MQLDAAAKEAVAIAQAKAKAGDDYELSALKALRHYPVSIQQFIEDPAYLGSDAVYPAIMQELVDLNNPIQPGSQHRARLWTNYNEALLTGAIGTGKTTISLYSLAYQLYVLSCFQSPHALFKLDPSSEIVFVFQNRTEHLAKAVDYDRFKAMVSASTYFQRHFPFDHRVKSELHFPNRIVVKPVAGTDTAALDRKTTQSCLRF